MFTHYVLWPQLLRWKTLYSEFSNFEVSLEAQSYVGALPAKGYKKVNTQVRMYVTDNNVWA